MSDDESHASKPRFDTVRFQQFVVENLPSGPPPMPLCRDCRFAKPYGWWPFRDYSIATCRHPDARHPPPRLTDGKQPSTFCSVERAFGNCGGAGKLWEQKP